MADESSRRVYVGLSAALIAAAAFAVIFWGMARFMPVFLRFTHSPWAHLLPVLSGLVIFIFILTVLLKAKRRAA
jgi:hypothetical protein